MNTMNPPGMPNQQHNKQDNQLVQFGSCVSYEQN